jgi:hypothetical protein
MSAITAEDLLTLDENLDKVIDKLKTTLKLLERVKSVNTQSKAPSDVVTYLSYKNCMIVQFAFNEELKNFLKDLGGKWMLSKRGWMFSKDRFNEIDEAITTNFENYKIVRAIESEAE